MPDTDGRPRWSIAPDFIVDDVVATANYYRDRLGFAYDRFWGEPPGFCMVHRAGVTIMLSQLCRTGVSRPNRLADSGADDCWDAYIWVDDADALFAEFTARGVKITRPICEPALRLPRLRRGGPERLPALLRAFHQLIDRRRPCEGILVMVMEGSRGD